MPIWNAQKWACHQWRWLAQPQRHLKKIADIMEPVEEGNIGDKYILTVQCDLSKYVEGYLLQTKDTVTVARSFVTNFILRYGIPREIPTDQETEFISLVMTKVFALLGVKKDEFNCVPLRNITCIGKYT